jgi:hypothetical protein
VSLTFHECAQLWSLARSGPTLLRDGDDIAHSRTGYEIFTLLEIMNESDFMELIRFEKPGAVVPCAGICPVKPSG